MDLHLIGGFLGSGKTTAIIGVSELLLQLGYRTGVVTNDQGKHLVDTAFVQANNIPAVEVTEGCFCCNYATLETQLNTLKGSDGPDYVFAEAVGSCADLVATVVKPLQMFRGADVHMRSLSVFVDSRLLLRRLTQLPLPFSDDVTYIFDKQIEESNLLIINKIDLLQPDQTDEILHLAQFQFPDKHILAQNSRDRSSLASWLTLLQNQPPLPGHSLTIDYERYGQGEMDLAWFDGQIVLKGLGVDLDAATPKLIMGIAAAIRHHQLPIGHLKFLVRSGQKTTKVSLTSLEDPAWSLSSIQPLQSPLWLLINARVETQNTQLQTLIQDVVSRVVETHALRATVKFDSFHPSRPQPTYRIP